MAAEEVVFIDFPLAEPGENRIGGIAGDSAPVIVVPDRLVAQSESQVGIAQSVGCVEGHDVAGFINVIKPRIDPPAQACGIDIPPDGRVLFAIAPLMGIAECDFGDVRHAQAGLDP